MNKEKLLNTIIDNALLITLITLVIILWSKGHFNCKCPVYQCSEVITNNTIFNWTIN